MENENINDWLESGYLLVKDVQDGDIIKIEEVIGLVESFGKKKLCLQVEHNGKSKTLNLNKVQALQMGIVRSGEKFTITKIKINGGIALNYKPLIQRIQA